MPQIRFTRVLSLLLAALTAAGVLSACASTDSNSTDTAAVTTAAPSIAETTVAAETEPAYIYPDVTYDNDEFVMLNCEDRYQMIYQLIPVEMNGEPLNDVRYELNKRIGERFQIQIKETQDVYENIVAEAQRELLANNPVHDVFFLPPPQIASFMASGYMHNLLDIDTIQIEADWWYQTLIEDGMMKDKYLYYLGGNYHVQAMEATTAIFFNKQMAENLGTEDPYQLVRDGKWTLDKLYTLTAQAANLNGDSSFASFNGGNSIFGMVGMTNMSAAFLLGGEGYYVQKNDAGDPVITFTNEHFVNACTKAAKITGSEGIFKFNDHIALFKEDRALFLGCEVKSAANELRDMTSEFGILPVPKYDEAQEEHISNLLWSTFFLSIPVTCEDPERAGIILDALNYEAMRDVLPVYYERVCYKGLRDEDSIEMLNIIREGMYYNWGLSYDWLDSIEPTVNNEFIKVGNGNVSSIAARAAKVVQRLIDKTMESFQ